MSSADAAPLPGWVTGRWLRLYNAGKLGNQAVGLRGGGTRLLLKPAVILLKNHLIFAVNGGAHYYLESKF